MIFTLSSRLWPIYLSLLVSALTMGTEAKAETSIRALTLNVWGLPDWVTALRTPKGFPFFHREARIQKTCQSLKDANSRWDVVFIQEAWLSEDRKTLENSCGYPHFVHRDTGGFPFDSGLVILSKHPVEEVKTLSFQQSGGIFGDEENRMRINLGNGEYFAKKGALAARLRIGARSVWAVNTHLVAQYFDARGIKIVGNQNKAQRHEQMKELSRFIHDLRSENSDPVVLAGDFNFGPTGGKYEELWEKIGSHFLPGFSSGKTITESEEFKSFYNSHSYGQSSHIFASPEINSIQTGITFKQETKIDDQTVPVSDHFGWEAKLELPYEVINTRSLAESKTPETVR